MSRFHKFYEDLLRFIIIIIMGCGITQAEECNLTNCTLYNDSTKVVCDVLDSTVCNKTSFMCTTPETMSKLDVTITALDKTSVACWTYLAARPLVKRILVCCGCDHEPTFRDEVMRSLWQRILFSDELGLAITIPAAVGFISSYINWRYIPLIVSIPPTIVGGAQILTDLYKALSKLAKNRGKGWYHKFFGKYWIGIGKPNPIMEYERDLKYLEKLNKMDESDPRVREEKRITCLHLLEDYTLVKLEGQNMTSLYLLNNGITFSELYDKLKKELPDGENDKGSIISKSMGERSVQISFSQSDGEVLARALYSSGVSSNDILQIETQENDVMSILIRHELVTLLRNMEQQGNGEGPVVDLNGEYTKNTSSLENML